MNFIDKLRIKRNPNIIDSLSSDKLKNDIVQYAINCGYQFNPDTMEKLIGIQCYRENFKNQDEVFQYMKQSVLNQSNIDAKKDFYNLYSVFGREMEQYINIVKSDSELSESYVKELEEWKKTNPYFNFQNLINIIDGKTELLNELLENHLSDISKIRDFKIFAEYVTSIKSPQELYDKNIKVSEFDKAYINSANPENFIELFDNFNEKDFLEFQALITEKIEDNIEKFLPYLEQLDKAYNSKTGKSVLTQDIKDKAISYLKENNILYGENVPEFALRDDEYVLQCIRSKSINYAKNEKLR